MLNKRKQEKSRKTKGFFILLKRYLKRFNKLFILMVIFVFFTALARIIQPKILENLMSSLFSNEEYWPWLAVMVVMLVLIAFFTFINTWIGGKLGKRIEVEVRKDTLKNLIKQDVSFYSDKKSGETFTKVISDTAIVGDQSQRVPSQLLSVIFTLVGGAIVLFTIDVWLTLITLGATFLIIVFIFVTFGILRKNMLQNRGVITRVNGQVTDKLGAIGLIKSSGTEAKENQVFDSIHEEYYDANRKTNNSMASVITFMTAGILSISIIVIISAVLLYGDDVAKLSVVLVPFLTGVSLMVGPIIQTAQLSQGIAQASAASERVLELINKETMIDILDDKNKIKIDDLSGNIVFQNVTFAYPEKSNEIIFPKTSFTFEEGKKYSFVGETGVGKSTISKLLLRYYDPIEGQILINDDVDLKDVYLPSYLERVGYVEQDPQILYGTIKDNVSYGLDDVSDEDVIEACKKAKIDDIIKTWPEGYDTIIGERGVNLSGGQKQRLVLARMFLKNPKLLIFDEATSALDNIIEKEIGNEIEKLSEGRTTITIAHRLSTIKNSDEIIVLKKGEGIVEVGTFNELINKDGYFKDLYEAGSMKED